MPSLWQSRLARKKASTRDVFFVLLHQQLLGRFLRQGIVVFLDFVQLLRTGTLVCVGVRSMWSLLRWTTAVS